MKTDTDILIVRGDLSGCSGWTKATLKLVDIFTNQFHSVYGVDLYSHPMKKPCNTIELITEKEADFISGNVKNVIVIHACLPDRFRKCWGAVNVAYWFWETDKISSQWMMRCNLMDYHWVASPWQKDIVSKFFPKGRVAVVPWIQEGTSTALTPRAEKSQEKILVLPALSHNEIMRTKMTDTLFRLIRKCLRIPKVKGKICSALSDQKRKTVMNNSLPLESVNELYDQVFLAVQSDVPRKGFSILIAEWLLFLKRTKLKSALLIKYSSINVNKSATDKHIDACEIINAIALRMGMSHVHIFFIHCQLSEGRMHYLFRNCSAYVTATLGEGFGGPIAEAILQNTLVIAPKHTGCDQILPGDYPLTVHSLPAVVSLIGALPVYSQASTWHIPLDSSLADKLMAFEEMSAHNRQALLMSARRNIESRLSADLAKRALANIYEVNCV